jgi:hypothetical protein
MSKAKTATHNFWKTLSDAVCGDLDIENPNGRHSKKFKKTLVNIFTMRQLLPRSGQKSVSNTEGIRVPWHGF